MKSNGEKLFRLKFANRDNPSRFRQGFSQMLAVQLNKEADQAFEAELRLLKAELSDENLYDQLEEYLRREDWRQADAETAWLFYVVMVLQGYSDWIELLRKFPSAVSERNRSALGFLQSGALWFQCTKVCLGCHGRNMVHWY